MNTLAIVLQAPMELRLDRVGLNPPGDEDVVVDVEWSGVSAGTERLLWSGRMPMFPGMGYPLVPGYESVGTIVDAGTSAKISLANVSLYRAPIATQMCAVFLAVLHVVSFHQRIVSL